MKTKKINFIFFTLFLTLLNFHSISPNILTSTPIKTGASISEHAFVENLKVGDEVLSCKFTALDNEKLCVEFIKIPIKEIRKIKLKKLIFIETNVGQICVGENKKFYNSKNNNWVDAKNLTIKDELLDINFKNISIEKISIQNLDEKIDSYELLLEEPHTFFICDSNGNPILVHNWVIAIPVLTWTFGEGVTIIGLSTAAVAIGKQVFNGIIKHFAKKKGVDVYNFDLEIEVPNIGPAGPDPEDPDKHKKEIKNKMTKGTIKESKTKNIYKKNGGLEQLEKDFENIHPNNSIKTVETPKGPLYLKQLGNGLKLIKRTFSSNKQPTLELQQEGIKKAIKIRYK